jgi:DUF2075 family protein
VIVYQETKAGFLRDAFTRDIEEVILAAFKRRTGRAVARSEVRSWKESLVAIARVVNDASVPDDAGVGIEYGIPQTSKRIDFILSGMREDQRDQLVIVELKQWDSAKKTDRDGIVRTRFAGGEADTSASLLRDFNEAVYEGDVGLDPCAYLHNYAADGILTDPFYGEYLAKAPVFLKGEAERQRLRAFIARHVRKGDQGKLLYRLESGRIRPSKGLVDALRGMLAGQAEFVLVDDQKVVYETALDAAREAAATGKKHVVIVDGGPGTGKSVVAINLLVALTEGRFVTKYVTKNAAPRDVFKAKLSGSLKRTRIDNLFVGSGAFVDTASNVFDALVVDEAHRLNERSGLYQNQGEHQVTEIIGAAKCAIFFIDEDQRVTWKDIGEKADIERRAKRAGARVTHLRLESQFRCSGSDGYLAWLDDSLAIRQTANATLDPKTEFDFRVFDSPEELRRIIEQRNGAANKARMVAGYCWDWKSKKDSKAVDVVIPEHGFGMQWNLVQDGGLWIMAPDSVKQIGCIHTCQGLEVDYIGVIVGPDLVVRDGKVKTFPLARSRQDQSIKGYKQVRDTDPEAPGKADLIIKNTYRTLMTRGMKGCYVYCTDEETRDWFKGRLAGS